MALTMLKLTNVMDMCWYILITLSMLFVLINYGYLYWFQIK